MSSAIGLLHNPNVTAAALALAVFAIVGAAIWWWTGAVQKREADYRNRAEAYQNAIILEIRRVGKLYADKRMPGYVLRAWQSAGDEFCSLGRSAIWVKDEAGVACTKQRSDEIIAELQAAVARQPSAKDLDQDAAGLRAALAEKEQSTADYAQRARCHLVEVQQETDGLIARAQGELESYRQKVAEQLALIEQQRAAILPSPPV